MVSKLPITYTKVVEDLKSKIQQARMKAVLTANVQVLSIYSQIGAAIAEQENEQGWGAKVVEQLAKDLKNAFPDFKGLSPRNLRYMRDFVAAWPELSILQQPAATDNEPLILQHPVAKLPWGHCCVLLDKIKDGNERKFYAQKTVENGWSRNILINQIEAGLFQRQGQLQHNFHSTLPATQSDLAKELFKDPYKFDFFQLSEEAHERDLENALIDHITKFLLEMGKGFSYVGRQVHLEKGGQDYYIDLLLYHLKLHAYVVLELKVGDFKPEYAGKMNFYLSAIDDDYKTPDDKPTIGLILCKSKNKVTVEYALRNVNKPMGVAEYQLTQAIPKELKGDLPSIEALEQEMEKDIEVPQKPIAQKINRLKEVINQMRGDGIKKERDNESIIYLFNEFLPLLMEKIEILLTDIIPEFRKKQIARSINDRYESTTSVDLEATLIKESVHRIGLNIRLEGFIKGGTKAFNIYKDLRFELQQYYYQITLSLGSEKKLAEKLYHQQWTEEETEQLAETIAEIIIDDVNENIERIKSVTT